MKTVFCIETRGPPPPLFCVCTVTHRCMWMDAAAHYPILSLKKEGREKEKYFFMRVAADVKPIFSFFNQNGNVLSPTSSKENLHR